MAQTCSHCKRKIGCGCQQTTASDKKIVCKTCKNAYEAALAAGLVKK
tara:strand:+ start:4604 stop:4744 length:141 start_codon:yes stop_codon:yes gene_type:complete